ncbi:MAG: T9SS type A sorting domain-containing protein [Candidatus Cloacimonetes bacterium]|nr:T9SS type A sorting domain-containing protein [Candidatus Cloacimonadota bacterium]
MEKKFTFIVLLLVSVMCFAEISFEQQFSIPIEWEGCFKTSMWMDNIDNDEQDELYVSYCGWEEDCWYLVKYSLQGDTLDVFAIELDNEEGNWETFSGCTFYKTEDTSYLVTVYDQCDWSSRNCRLKVYDFNTMTLLDTFTSVISGGAMSDDYFMTKYIKLVDYNETEYLYVGLETQYNMAGASGWDSFTYKFIFDEGSLSYLEELPDCGRDLIQPNGADFMLSIGKEGYYWSGSGTHNNYILNRISYNTPAGLEEIINVYEDDQLYLNYLTMNDEYYQDYGPVIWESLNNLYYGYSPDLTEILWQQPPAIDYSYFMIYTSTCINTNLGDNYLLTFYTDHNIKKAEVRNRMTGYINLTEGVDFIPSQISRGSTGELFFFNEYENLIEVYTLAEEIQVSRDECEIEHITYNLSNYPNPFNPTTTISFNLAEESEIELAVFNLKGQKIVTLADGNYKMGVHEIIWNGENESGKIMASGVYFYRLRVNDKAEMKRLLMLK